MIDEFEHKDHLATYDALMRRGDEYLKIVVDSGKLAVQSSILLNGGAAVAIMALVGNVITDSQNNVLLMRSLLNGAEQFARGAMVAAFSAGLAYVTNYCGLIDYSKQSDYVLLNRQPKGKITHWGRLGIILNVVTASAVIASYYFFYQGISIVKDEFLSILSTFNI